MEETIEPDIHNFEEAISEFKERIPKHAQALRNIIKEEYQHNKSFQVAFSNFAELCRTSIAPQLEDTAINEMLVQHLLTERLFHTVFNNPDFLHRNLIAAEIEKVLAALANRNFNRHAFQQPLHHFYIATEEAAQQTRSWSEQQEFLNTIYQHFFQGIAIKQADTHGIVYTPQEIVDFMVESVDVVLKQEFGKSIQTPGVKILDPATGMGNFIVNIMRRLPTHILKEKYANDLLCNEIMLFPYYIASLNIEHEYYAKMHQYKPFEGIHFADTLELPERQQLSSFVEKETDLLVVIGNPPYNVGQKNENDNNKNRKYPIINQQIHNTYAKNSQASNKNALSDAYVKFFRWATDRLQGRDGIIYFISNNSFIEGYAFDGFRKCVTEEFSSIYHIDLGGNARKKGGGNVFNITVGVGITLLIRNRQNTQPPHPPANIYYHKVNDAQKAPAKLKFLAQAGSIKGIEWQELQPDEKHTWITEGMQTDFSTFIPLGTKDTKASSTANTCALFKTYGRGIATCRDDWAYDFDEKSLMHKIQHFITTYNNEVDNWQRHSSSSIKIDDFVSYDDTKIKWSEGLKGHLQRGHTTQFAATKIRRSLYRPFCRKWLYFDRILNERVYQFPQILPTPNTEEENIIIWLKVGSEWPMFALATNIIPDLLPQGGSQCFPYYTYTQDGTHRRENITDWALQQFQTKYGQHITKWNIFHYIYGMLQHPQYRELYRENLKHALPHIPLVVNEEAFATCVRIGKQLMTIHVQYETQDEYPLHETYNREQLHQQSLRVDKMKLSTDKTTLTYNKSLTLSAIPQTCHEYRLGNRSALEWIIDQYQVSTDKRTNIESDPNRQEDAEYIVRLVKQVVMVSVKTVELVKELGEVVTDEDWVSG